MTIVKQRQAEFTQEYANKFGHHVEPTEAAVSTAEGAAAK